jgi:hypothetical protein
VNGAIDLPREALGFMRSPTALHAGLLVADTPVVAITVHALVRQRRGIEEGTAHHDTARAEPRP